MLTPVQQVASANPSFVALDPSKRFLYVVNEIDDYGGKKSGSIEAYAIDADTGTLKLLNRQTLNSPIPAHLAVLYVIDELNATVTVLAYDPAAGRISQALQTISTEPQRIQ